MVITVIAETKEVDIKAYQILVSKIIVKKFGYSENLIEYRQPRTSYTNKGSLIKQLTTLLEVHYHKNPEIELVIIIIDVDSSTPTIERQKVEQQINKLEIPIKNKIIIGLPKRNLEAWLLSDEKNINSITGLVQETRKDVEKIHDPKGEFKGIHTNYRKSLDVYKKQPTYAEFVSEVMTGLDLERGLKKSKSLKSFYDCFNTGLILQKA